MAETRKLAAILAADVAGYSKLAGSDEERNTCPPTGSPKRSDRSDHRRAQRSGGEAHRRREHR